MNKDLVARYIENAQKTRVNCEGRAYDQKYVKECMDALKYWLDMVKEEVYKQKSS